MTAKKPSAERTHQLIAAGLELASKHGYLKVTRDQLAQATQLAAGSINLHFGTMGQFQRALMRAAVKQKVLRVVAQGLAHNDSVALRASPELKAAAADSLKG